MTRACRQCGRWFEPKSASERLCKSCAPIHLPDPIDLQRQWS